MCRNVLNADVQVLTLTWQVHAARRGGSDQADQLGALRPDLIEHVLLHGDLNRGANLELRYFHVWRVSAASTRNLSVLFGDTVRQQLLHLGA